MNVVLEVLLDDDMELDDYAVNFRRMFGNERMDAVLGSVDGSVRFYGLTPTSMKLEGLDRHQRLIDNYKKLHWRSLFPDGFAHAGDPLRGLRTVPEVVSKCVLRGLAVSRCWVCARGRIEPIRRNPDGLFWI
jgi:hypothetical protein